MDLSAQYIAPGALKGHIVNQSTRAAALLIMVASGCGRSLDPDVGAAVESLDLSNAGAEAHESESSDVEGEDEELPPGTIELKDGKAAFEHDVGVVAEQQNLPLDQAHASLTYQRDFAEYAEELLKRYPNKLAAVWVDPLPARSGHVVFVGPVPAAERPARAGVELRGGGKMSMDEQYVRVQNVMETMVALGHQDHDVHFEQQTQRIVLKSRPDSAGRMVDVNAVATQATERLRCACRPSATAIEA